MGDSSGGIGFALIDRVLRITLKLTRGAVAVHGLSIADFQHGAELGVRAKGVLGPLLRAQGFDVIRAIHVEHLPDDRGFRLTQ
jgi:hypothetical protein